MICKICGKEFKASNHIKKKHNLTSKEYYDLYIKTENECKCKICDKPTEFLSLNNGYRSFCSVKCAQNDKEVRNKVLETTKNNLLEKYGVINVQQIQEVREKTKRTCLEKYGNEYAIAAKETKQKISDTQKSKLKNYKGLIKTDDVSKIYGTGWYQTPVRKALNIEIIMKGRYAYIRESDISKIEDYLHSDLRHSKKESELLQFLESIYTKEIFHNYKNKTAIYPYELDFYLPELKLGIEYNSLYYHSLEKGNTETYHLMKSLLCRDKNIRLIHIYEFEDFEQQKQLLKDLILGQDNYNKNDFNKNNLLDSIPEPEIIYKDNGHTIYGAGKLY